MTGHRTISYVLNDPDNTELLTEMLCENTRVPCKGERVVTCTYDDGEYLKHEYRVADVVHFIGACKHHYLVVLETMTEPENEKSAGSVSTDYWSR